jgi:hypothetical protein
MKAVDRFFLTSVKLPEWMLADSQGKQLAYAQAYRTGPSNPVLKVVDRVADSVIVYDLRPLEADHDAIMAIFEETLQRLRKNGHNPDLRGLPVELVMRLSML